MAEQQLLSGQSTQPTSTQSAVIPSTAQTNDSQPTDHFDADASNDPLQCLHLSAFLLGCLISACLLALTVFSHPMYGFVTAQLIQSSTGPLSRSDCYCGYGSSAYRGFWVIDRMLYLHAQLHSPCQLRPLAWQLRSLSSAASANDTEPPPWTDNLLINATVTVPDGWPANFSVGQWLASQEDSGLVEQLRGAVIVLIGDSLDRFLFRAVCGQMSAAIHQFEDLQGGLYAPMACRSSLNNFTVLHLHHYGVLHVWWPSSNSVARKYDFTTEERVRVHLPQVLSRLDLRPSDVSLVQVSSGLWDLSNKNSTFAFSAHILHRHWLPLMRSQLMDPLLALWGSAPTQQLPPIVLRTSPPTRWGEASQRLVALLNEGVRSLYSEYTSRGVPVVLLEMAVMLAERQSWCMDQHHYSEVTELQRANVLLHLLLQHRRTQRKAKHTAGGTDPAVWQERTSECT